MRAHAFICNLDRTVKLEVPVDNLLTLFDLVGALARLRYQAAERHFATLSLNHTEARLLTLLGQEKGEATQDDLSALLFVDRSNAGRALKNLEQSGHIVREKDASDRRTNIVRLTPNGNEAVGKIAEMKKAIAREFFGELSEKDAAAAIQLLNKALPKDNA